MSNEVDNGLYIKCANHLMLERLKSYLFKSGRTSNNGIIDLKINGCNGWDVRCKENESEIFISFLSRWYPQMQWLSVLCSYMDDLLLEFHGTSNQAENVRVEYRYICPGSDYAGIVKWSPEGGFTQKEYNSVREYFRTEDKRAFDTIVQMYCPVDEEYAFQCYAHYSGL